MAARAFPDAGVIYAIHFPLTARFPLTAVVQGLNPDQIPSGSEPAEGHRSAAVRFNYRWINYRGYLADEK